MTEIESDEIPMREWKWYWWIIFIAELSLVPIFCVLTILAYIGVI